MAGEYSRFHTRYFGRLGVEVGLFVAVDHLRRAGDLADKEVELYLDVDDWFRSELPNPPFYEDGNKIGAVTWFKDPLPAEMVDRVAELCGILQSHKVDYQHSRSADPGRIVYEDPFQVGVVPYSRESPTPLPEGVVLGPTSAGSKRSFN
ncbi:hypothetical protein [Arthrobacter sp. Soil782]|uniref:hypothetical protein n=1 Tax=Arthrobacter sp. Soil782 TaxID=1736410 RepID=UPI000B26219B|nr:hypothetical protein [Arthrobacter sp. Soil782]